MGKLFWNVGLRPLILIFALAGCTEVDPDGSFFGSVLGNKAVLSGMPNTYNQDSNFNLGVSGSDIQAYRSKWGPAISTDCTSPVGYVPAGPAEDAVGTPLSVAAIGADDNYIVCVIGRDSDGVWQDESDATYFAWTKDTAAPGVTSFVKTPSQLDPTNGTTIEFLISFDEPMDASTVIASAFNVAPAGPTTINSVSPNDSQNYVISVDVLSPIDSNISVSLSASLVADLAGNVAAGSGSSPVGHDSVPPIVSINAPSNATPINVSSSVAVSGVCEHNGGANGLVEISGPIVGSPVTTSCNSGDAFSVNVDFTGGDGTKNLNISQDDDLLNTGVNTYNIDIDETPPLLTLDSHSNNDSVPAVTSVSGNNCEVGLNVDISGPGLMAPQSFLCSGGTYSSAPLSFTSGDGLKSFNVSQTDPAGNVTSIPITLDVDSFGPNITVVTGPSGTYQNTQTVIIEVHFDEPITYDPAGGTPFLDLETGPTDYQANYNGTVIGTVAYFDYNVTSDAYSPDLDYLSSLLIGNGSFFRDAAGNSASLMLPSPGTPMSLSQGVSDANDIVIVGTPADVLIAADSTNNFGQEVIGGVSGTLSFTLSNPSNTPATLGTIFSATSNFDFDSTTCGATLLNGFPCTVDMEFQPQIGGDISGPGEYMQINFNDGTGPNNSTHPLIGEGMFVVESYYAGRKDWNTYISNNGGKYGSTGALCSGAEPGNYIDSCFHAGEMKKVEVPNFSSCIGISLIESLDIFDWDCDDSGGAPITFFTTGLKDDKGLRDLINSGTGGWESNSIVIDDGGTVGSSFSLTWWDNAVIALPTNTTPNIEALTVAGAVYFHDSNISNWNYDIAADEISIVSLAGASIGRNAGDSFLGSCDRITGAAIGSGGRVAICASAQRQLWLEVNLDGFSSGSAANAEIGILFGNVSQSVIYNTNIHSMYRGSSDYGIRMAGGGKNIVYRTRIFDAGGGVELQDSGNNILKELKLVNLGANSTGGVRVTGVGSVDNHLYKLFISNVQGGSGAAFGVMLESANNIIEKMNISNIYSTPAPAGLAMNLNALDNNISEVLITAIQGRGVWLNSASRNSLTRLTIANTNGPGIYLQGVPADNMFNHNVLVNGNDGIYSTVTSGNNVFTNTVSAHNGDRAFDGTGSSANVTFNGYIQVESGATCSGTGSNLSGGCNNSGGRIVQDVDTGAFVGVVASDASNPLGVIISLFTSILSLDDWIQFDSHTRAWGKELGVNQFLDRAMSGFQPPSGSLQIYDYSALGTGDFHQTSFNGTADNGFNYGATANCPTGLNGGDFQYHPKSPATNPYLFNAFEISFDGKGDDDTLCESGEDCVYAPNKGGYQGDGNVYAHSCNFTDGIITDVEIYAFPNHGN